MSIITKSEVEESAESERLAILCPKCNDLVIAEFGSGDIDVEDECSCVKNGELTQNEWYEMVYRLWDDFQILQIPDEMDIKEEE